MRVQGAVRPGTSLPDHARALVVSQPYRLAGGVSLRLIGGREDADGAARPA